MPLEFWIRKEMKAITKLGVIVAALLICYTEACPDIICAIFCTYGNVIVNGCKICECIDPCKDIICTFPKVCEPNPYNCSSSGTCLANPKCKINCPAIDCIRCPYGYEVDQYGCQTCTCIDPCKKHICRDDEEYIVESVPCRDDTPCGYKPICKKKCKELNCTLLRCRYGYEVDCYNCPICKCRSPCKGVVCPPYHYCTVQFIYCLIPPCPPPFAICESYCKSNQLLYDENGFPVTCSSQACPKGFSCTAVPANKNSFCCSIPLN